MEVDRVDRQAVAGRRLQGRGQVVLVDAELRRSVSGVLEPGVVAGGSEHRLVVQIVEQLAQVISAQIDVGVHRDHVVALEARQAESARHLSRGARHQLHEPLRPGAGARIGDEAAFLPH